MSRALLVGAEPPCSLGYTHVKEPPFDAVVIGSLTLGQMLHFSCEEALSAALSPTDFLTVRT